MEIKERTRKVFAPILVGENVKERFNRKKKNKTAEEYLEFLMAKDS